MIKELAHRQIFTQYCLTDNVQTYLPLDKEDITFELKFLDPASTVNAIIDEDGDIAITKFKKPSCCEN